MFNRPDLATLVQRIRDDVLSRLAADDPLRRADAEVYARVMAGATHGLYGYLDWLARNIIIDTADTDMLARWASVWGVNRIPAAAATGSVSFTVQAGYAIPAGTQLRAPDGVIYQTTADATGVAPTATAPVAAVVPAAAGNRTSGQALTLVSPITSVAATATAGELSGGADIESDDALRARLLTRIQTPPQGGAAADYVAWALQVPGVTRAWIYPQELGIGTVSLRFVRDNDAVSIIPDSGEVAAVQAWIDARRPVTAALTVLAPVAVPLNFTLGVTPNTADVKAAVQAELQSLLLREAIPGGTLLLSHIRAAISAAVGETNYTMSLPAADVVNTTGNMSTSGAITWV